MSFDLHPQLKQDTLFITYLGTSQLLLKNDKRFPWLILVPHTLTAREIHELPFNEQHQLWLEITKLSKLLSHVYQPDKLNLASLGNLVPQLHIHIIVRYKTDSAWPAPVWGFGEPIPYLPQKATETIYTIKQALALPLFS